MSFQLPFCRMMQHQPNAKSHPLCICNWGYAGGNAATNELPQVFVFQPLVSCHAKYGIHGVHRRKLIDKASDDEGSCQGSIDG